MHSFSVSKSSWNESSLRLSRKDLGDGGGGFASEERRTPRRREHRQPQALVAEAVRGDGRALACAARRTRESEKATPRRRRPC